jgi:hypothetical protein
LVVDNDGWHQPASKEATVPLGAGTHAFSLSYYQGPRERIALQLFVSTEGGKWELFGPII